MHYDPCYCALLCLTLLRLGPNPAYESHRHARARSNFRNRLHCAQIWPLPVMYVAQANHDHMAFT